MVQSPLSFISLFIFSATFNFSFSAIMFYLRSKGDTRNHTKSQLWGLTILAFLFLLNGVMNTTEAIAEGYETTYNLAILWPARSLWYIMMIFTGALLLAFGLVYPRPVTGWSKLRYIIFAVMLFGLGLVVLEIQTDHEGLPGFFYFYVLDFIYIPAIFVPVFIWLSQYSRAPSKEGRMMYTIFIWGFLFSTISELMEYFSWVPFVIRSTKTSSLVYLILLVLVLIRLVIALKDQKKRWGIPEWTHIIMLSASLFIGISGGIFDYRIYMANFVGQYPREFYKYFAVRVFGWAIMRPLLFSYGLLRYRLLGTKVKAESALAIFVAVVISSILGLGAMNLGGAEQNPAIAGIAIVIVLVLLYPLWRFSQSLVTRLLPMSAGIKGVSMKEKRNTYMMALQTAVVHGQVTDEDDRESLVFLRKELGLTQREHDLLLESIALHEVRRKPKREIQEAYLMFRDGRLLAHYTTTEEGKRVESGGSRSGTGKDSDIVAGMFAAITEYVKEAMSREEGARASMDTISYGASSLAMETEENIVLAVVLHGLDDVMLRHSMRDTLAEVNERYGKVLIDGWDGDRAGTEGIDELLKGFIERVARWEK